MAGDPVVLVSVTEVTVSPFSSPPVVNRRRSQSRHNTVGLTLRAGGDSQSCRIHRQITINIRNSVVAKSATRCRTGDNAVRRAGDRRRGRRPRRTCQCDRGNSVAVLQAAGDECRRSQSRHNTISLTLGTGGDSQSRFADRTVISYIGNIIITRGECSRTGGRDGVTV